MDGLDDVFSADELGMDDNFFEEEAPVATVDDNINDVDSIFNEDDILEQNNNTNPLVNSLLEAKGITNGKITILDEDDQETEVSFFDLSQEEQLEILNADPETTEPQNNQVTLDASIQELVDKLKANNLTLDQYLEQHVASTIEGLGRNTDPVYEIDSYGDEELFMLDLKEKYDLSDEELQQELETALTNKPLFDKKVAAIRTEYKELEDLRKQQQQQEFEQQQQAQYDEFVNKMTETAINSSEFYGLELEDDEKNEVLSTLVELDDNGTSEFYRTISNPAKLFEAAWFLKYGKEAFDAITTAYESEITKLKSQIKDKPGVVVRDVKNKNNNKSIYDV